MLFEINHITEYSYSEEVFFEPHYFRFKPKSTAHSSVAKYSIEIEPKPAGFSELVDSENNNLLHCWFNDTHKKLKVTVKTQLEFKEFNPLDFLVYPSEYLQIPFNYDEQTKQLLQPYLNTASLPLKMTQFLSDILLKTDAQTLTFLNELNRSIHNNFKSEIRELGDPYKPEFTFEHKLGSCRDLSWMLIHMLRHVGIACRFVSGYFYLIAEKPEFELHAWVEVYLPGAGWIGYDPTHGLVTGCYHIPLAASAFFNNTMPVSGAIRGSATSELKTTLKIAIIKNNLSI